MNPGRRWMVEVSADGRAEVRGAGDAPLSETDSLALAEALHTLAARLRLTARNSRPHRRSCA